MDSLLSNQASVSSPDIPVIRTSQQSGHTFPPEGSFDQNSPIPEIRYDRRMMPQNTPFAGPTPTKDSLHHPYYSADQSDRTESIQNTPYGYPFMSPPPGFANSHQINSLVGYGQDPQEYGMDKDHFKKNSLNDPHQYHGHPNQNLFSGPQFQPQHYLNHNPQQYQHHFQSQQHSMQKQSQSQPSSQQKASKRPKSPTDSVSSKDNSRDTELRIRRRKKRLLKKAPNAPKRGKSAYICYSIAKRPEIQAELGPNAKATDVVVRIAATWRELPEEEKKVWEKKANADKRRYQHEIQEYDGPMKIPNKRIKKNPDAPKRGMSAFLLYSQVMRSQLKKLNPTSKNTEISRMLGEHWNQLSLEKKQPFIDQANEENSKYLTEMGQFKQVFSKGIESVPSTPGPTPGKKTSKSNPLTSTPTSEKKEKKSSKKEKMERIENYEI